MNYQTFTNDIVANGTPFVEALHQATRSIPIVFVLSNDPVGLGHVASMARPGGNITGFIFMELSLIGKWLELLKQMAPGLSRTALLFNPDTKVVCCDPVATSPEACVRPAGVNEPNTIGMLPFELKKFESALPTACWLPLRPLPKLGGEGGVKFSVRLRKASLAS
jgi:hypothetical protein